MSRPHSGQPPVDLIIWGALLMSQCILGVVLWVIAQQGGPAEMPPAAVTAAISMSALVSWLLALALPRYIRSPEKIRASMPEASPDEVSAAFMTIRIVAWGLGESGTLMGFILGLLGRNPAVFVPYLVTGLVIHALNFPTEPKPR